MSSCLAAAGYGTFSKDKKFKQMNKLFIFLLSIMLCNTYVYGGVDTNIQQDEIIVFQGKKKISSSGKTYSFALDKGDKVLIKMSIEKDKELKYVSVKEMNSGSIIWQRERLTTSSSEININKEGVYTFEFKAKGMGAREVTLDIVRTPGRTKLYNTAWMSYNTYTPEEIRYTVDTVIGYQAPVRTDTVMKVFHKYYYQKVDVFNYSKQILGQGGVHNSQGDSKPLTINNALVPSGAKFKSYNYNLSSQIGGAKHWALADIGVSAVSMALSPAASMAAHGAMGLIGPQPGTEPIQYFMSNRSSDLNTIKEIYSLYNQGRKVSNKAKDTTAKYLSKVSDKAADAVKGTKVKQYDENDLSFNQKGLVTNMHVSSAKPPEAKYIMFGNPDIAQAKNIKMNAYAIYYAPVFYQVRAEKTYYEVITEQLSKSKIKYTKSVHFGSVVQ